MKKRGESEDETELGEVRKSICGNWNINWCGV